MWTKTQKASCLNIQMRVQIPTVRGVVTYLLKCSHCKKEYRIPKDAHINGSELKIHICLLKDAMEKEFWFCNHSRKQLGWLGRVLKGLLLQRGDLTDRKAVHFTYLFIGWTQPYEPNCDSVLIYYAPALWLANIVELKGN